MTPACSIAYVPEFEPECCGGPLQWNRNESTSFWNEKAKKRGEHVVRADINKFLEFLAIRPDAEGKPISEKLGPASPHFDGWWRMQWLELSADADADLAAQGWQRAWHGSKMQALYKIMYQGHLVKGVRQLTNKPGVYVHKDSTQHKANNYMCFVPLMGDGVFWAVKWELRVNRQVFVPNPGSDQWVQPEGSSKLAALWVCGRNAAQMQNGDAVSWQWMPLEEANPCTTPPWRTASEKKWRPVKSSNAAKPAPPDYPPPSSSAAKPAPPEYPPPTSVTGASGKVVDECATSAAERALPDQLTPVSCVDALLKAVGDRMDAGESHRQMFEELDMMLWTGHLTITPRENQVRNPKSADKAKARLEILFQKAKSVREHYQNEAMKLGSMIKDVDCQRSLDAAEMMLAHNLYMNDVVEWMKPRVLRQYQALVHEAKELGNAKEMRGRSSKAKRWHRGSAAKPVHGPRQLARKMKKRHFDAMIRSFAVTKAFFMALVRHPMLMCVDGLTALAEAARQVKASKAYRKIMCAAAKERKVDTERKQERNAAPTAKACNPVMEAWLRFKEQSAALGS